MEQARKDRDKVASKKTLDLVKKLKPVEQATNEAEFITAADALALWVIGEGSVPDGIGVKNLVARIRLAYDALPKRSYPCEKTRTNGGVCYSPGKALPAQAQGEGWIGGRVDGWGGRREEREY